MRMEEGKQDRRDHRNPPAPVFRLQVRFLAGSAARRLIVYPGSFGGLRSGWHQVGVEPWCEAGAGVLIMEAEFWCSVTYMALWGHGFFPLTWSYGLFSGAWNVALPKLRCTCVCLGYIAATMRAVFPFKCFKGRATVVYDTRCVRPSNVDETVQEPQLSGYGQTTRYKKTPPHLHKSLPNTRSTPLHVPTDRNARRAPSAAALTRKKMLHRKITIKPSSRIILGRNNYPPPGSVVLAAS